MPLTRLLSAAVNLAVLAGIFTLTQPVAHAQFINVWDQSSSDTAWNGQMSVWNTFSYCAGFVGTGSCDTVQVGSSTIPGATIPAHNDCNCNSAPDTAINGYFVFEPQIGYHSATSEDSYNYYIVEALWELDQPESYQSSCNACPNCDNASDYTQGYPYYATVGGTYWIYLY